MSSENDKNKEKNKNVNKMKKLFGFDWDDVKSWSNLVNLLNRPEDPSSLAAFRILFGLLMILDIPNERGMTDADAEFGSSTQCHFPLFDFLKPLPVQWMLITYAIMFFGAFGIMIGFIYRISCLCFLIPYWYLFFLDKTTWNNHSYLYGLFGFLLLFLDANRYFSVDALLNKSIRNTHVPLWNYTLIRSQVFLVYFIAGLKKIDFDWIAGYSMSDLAQHWVFDPFKLFLTHEQITVFIVHSGGLFIDLFVGYLLFFDKTRLIGTILSSSFHIMNSQMFNIGMFPYAMLATTTIFYSNNWPKRLFYKFSTFGNNEKFYISRLSSHCIYNKSEYDNDESPDSKKNKDKKKNTTKQSLYHKFFTLFTIIYLTEQCIMPYSHFITKGYNNWTNGLYGYSWDMMIHSWHTQHIKIHFIDKNTNETHYLNPKAWTSRRRWSSHADMIYQYSNCIKERLRSYNYTNIELYIDVWRSMNHRFNQRQLDPRVNLIEAEWNPFKQTEWIIPLLTELSDWRKKMLAIEDEFKKKNRDFDLTFVADLNGLKLENYVSNYLNASIEVLNGQINVEIDETEKDKENNETKVVKKNVTMGAGEKLELPSGTYHTVYTISKDPSCFFYIYLNETAIILSDLYDSFLTNMMKKYNQTHDNLVGSEKVIQNSDRMQELIWQAYNITLIENSKKFLYMIAFNESDTNQDVQAEIKNIQKLFSEKNLNRTIVYEAFVDQFYDTFNDKIIKTKENVFVKFFNKILKNFLRFKQSFTMVYYAVKSIVSGQDFMKMIKPVFDDAAYY